MDDDASDKTDAAALGAGVVAVAMTVFGDSSVYDLLTVIVSAALMLLVLGYVARSRRDRFESLAFAAVLAIIILPTIGYAVEGRPGPWAKPPDLVPPGEIDRLRRVYGDRVAHLHWPPLRARSIAPSETRGSNAAAARRRSRAKR